MFTELGQGEGRGMGVIGGHYKLPPGKKSEERELSRTAGKAALLQTHDNIICNNLIMGYSYNRTNNLIQVLGRPKGMYHCRTAAVSLRFAFSITSYLVSSFIDILKI